MTQEKPYSPDDRVEGVGTLGEQNPEWQIVLSNINNYSKDIQNNPNKWPDDKLKRFISKCEEEMQEKGALKENFIDLAVLASNQVLDRVPIMSDINEKANSIDSIRTYAMDKIKELQDLQKSGGASQEISIDKYKKLVAKANELEQELKIAA